MSYCNHTALYFFISPCKEREFMAVKLIYIFNVCVLFNGRLLFYLQRSTKKRLWMKTMNAVHVLLALLSNIHFEYPSDEDSYEKQLHQRPLILEYFITELMKIFTIRFFRLFMLLLFRMIAFIVIYPLYQKQTCYKKQPPVP